MKKVIKELEKIFWVFIIGCILGYIFDLPNNKGLRTLLEIKKNKD